jgi:hypothetical protein
MQSNCFDAGWSQSAQSVNAIRRVLTSFLDSDFCQPKPGNRPRSVMVWAAAASAGGPCARPAASAQASAVAATVRSIARRSTSAILTRPCN